MNDIECACPDSMFHRSTSDAFRTLAVQSSIQLPLNPWACSFDTSWWLAERVTVVSARARAASSAVSSLPFLRAVLSRLLVTGEPEGQRITHTSPCSPWLLPFGCSPYITFSPTNVPPSSSSRSSPLLNAFSIQIGTLLFQLKDFQITTINNMEFLNAVASTLTIPHPHHPTHTVSVPEGTKTHHHGHHPSHSPLPPPYPEGPSGPHSPAHFIHATHTGKTALWVFFAIFAVSFLVVLVMAKRVERKLRLFHLITATILGVSFGEAIESKSVHH
jgi:hypothetical protein